MRSWLPFSKADLEDPGQRNALFVSMAQCTTAFSLNFVDIFLPFYIFKISPYSERETLLWVGAIVGLNGLILTVTSPIWGSLTHRFSPKKSFQRAQIAHTVLLLLMGFTTNLQLLFLIRLVQGIFGGVSTIGMILVTSSSPKERIPANIGLFQSSITLGQLLGPPLGTLTAATFGYRGSFLCASALLFAAFLFCQFKIADVPRLPKPEKQGIKQSIDRRILMAWIFCFIIQIQITFLPTILPKILEGFHIHGAAALKLAGVVVMCYTVATMTGTFFWTRFTKRVGLFRLITFLTIMGILFQAALSLSRGVLDITIIRMLQTGFVAAVVPLVISIFAAQQRGAVLGFLNASRFGGNAAGPMLAASILAASGFDTLCFLISGTTILALIGFRLVFK